MENRFFHSEPDEREPYTIVIPPPNVTGVLHMGHMLNNTIQDILTRRAVMWVKMPAGYRELTPCLYCYRSPRSRNKLKNEESRNLILAVRNFLEHAWEWTQ